MKIILLFSSLFRYLRYAPIQDRIVICFRKTRKNLWFFSVCAINCTYVHCRILLGTHCDTGIVRRHSFRLCNEPYICLPRRDRRHFRSRRRWLLMTYLLIRSSTNFIFNKSAIVFKTVQKMTNNFTKGLIWKLWRTSGMYVSPLLWPLPQAEATTPPSHKQIFGLMHLPRGPQRLAQIAKIIDDI